MNLTLESVLESGLAELSDALALAFRDYLVDIAFHPTLLAPMIRCDAVDLTVSRFALQNGKRVGVALIARRGWTSRLAAMGVFPEARRQGVGREMLDGLLEEARHRGERAMTLEVITQNTGAVRLYEQAGFVARRRLVGYTAESVPGKKDTQLQEVNLPEVARALMAYGPPDLPWQVSAETLAQMSLPYRGYRLGPAFAALSPPEQPHIALRALVVMPEARRQGWANRLLRALMAQYPGKTWKVPPLFPAEVAPGLFEKIGFQPEPLTQFQMTRLL